MLPPRHDETDFSQDQLERQAFGALCTGPENALRVFRHLRPGDFVDPHKRKAYLLYNQLRREHPGLLFDPDTVAGLLDKGLATQHAMIERTLKLCCNEHTFGLHLDELLGALSSSSERRGYQPGRGSIMNAGEVKDALEEVTRVLAQAQSVAQPQAAVGAVGAPEAQEGAERVGGEQQRAYRAGASGARDGTYRPQAVMDANGEAENQPQADDGVQSAPATTPRKRLFMKDVNRKIPVHEHLWHGLLAPGAVTLLHSRAKLGKSFLGFGLMRALLKGEAFLGRPTRPHGPSGPVPMVYMTEEGAETLRIKSERFGLSEEAPICFLSRREPEYAALSFEAALQAGFEVAREFKAGLLVLDTLSAWAGFGSKMEFAAVYAEAAFQVLKNGAEDLKIPVLVMHHSSKHGKGVRGSSALEGAPDVLIKMATPHPNSRRRYLQIDSRLCGGFTERIPFDPEGFSMEVNRRNNDDEKLLEMIPPEARGVSINELCAETDFSKSWVYEALGRLKTKGKIHIEKGDGSRFFPSMIWKQTSAA